MKNSQRSATMADAYQSIYLEEAVNAPEELPAYKKLQTAIADRKKLGGFVNDNSLDRKSISREEFDLDEFV